jgi:hypothetical protein
LLHAKALAAAGEKVQLMLSLDSLGNFSERPGSQRALDGIEAPLPDVGNFLLVLGTGPSQELARELANHLRRGTGLEILVRTLAEPDAHGLDSDDWAFRRVGIPALAVTDTKTLRGRPGPDALGAVNFDRLTRAVTALEAGVAALADQEVLQ